MRRVTVLAALALSLAAVAETSAAAATGDASARRCDRRVVLRYDITVSATKSGRETFPPDSAFIGEFSISYDYAARYPRARVVVDRGCDPEIDTVRVRASGTGTLQDYSWADRSTRRDPSDGDKLPCEFTLGTDPLRTGLALAAGTTVLGGGAPTFSVQSALRRSGEPPLLALIDGRREAVCNQGSFPNFPVSDELALHRSVPIFDRAVRAGGFKVEPPSIFLEGSFVLEARRNPRALTNLVAGRSARIATGVRRYAGTDSESSATASTSVTIRFDRRR
jgi:hypothetical protein